MLLLKAGWHPKAGRLLGKMVDPLFNMFFLCYFCAFLSIFFLFSVSEGKKWKTCFNKETNDFDQQTDSRAPICWLKYTTPTPKTNGPKPTSGGFWCKIFVALFIVVSIFGCIFLCFPSYGTLTTLYALHFSQCIQLNIGIFNDFYLGCIKTHTGFMFYVAKIIQLKWCH